MAAGGGAFGDIIRQILPRQPKKHDVLEADRELEDYSRQQKVLQQASTIEESVQRAVREELNKVKKDKPAGHNINQFDSRATISPESQGDSYPVTTGTSLTYGTLQKMSQVPIIGNIIETRLVQLSDFCRKQKHKNQYGYRVAMRDHARAPSTAALKRIQEIEAWFATCGAPNAQMQPSLEMFVGKVMRDSLTFDQACAQILLDKYGRPAAMIPVDAKTIRYAQFTGKELDNRQYDIANRGFIQKDSTGQITAEWDKEHFMFGVRRPRTMIESYGYGYPELETLAKQVTYLLQAEFYNAANFTNGVHAAGMMIVQSAMDAAQFKSLDQKLRQTLAGASNAHRMMFLQLDPEKKEDVKHIPFNTNNRDMEFSLWISWLLKIVCASYQMDPAEINYVYGNEGQRQSLGQQDPSERIAQSKERGIRPLLRFLEDWFNTNITYRLDEDFEFGFVGLENKSPLIQSQLDIQSLQWESINELRARHDLMPMEGWMFNVPANPTVIAIMAQEKQMTAQANQQMAQDQPGAPSEPGGGEPPEQLPAQFSQSLVDDAAGVGLDSDGYGDVDFSAVEDAMRNALPPGMSAEQLNKAFRFQRRLPAATAEM